MPATLPNRTAEPAKRPIEEERPPNYWVMVLWLCAFLFVIVAALVNYFTAFFVTPH